MIAQPSKNRKGGTTRRTEKQEGLRFDREVDASITAQYENERGLFGDKASCDLREVPTAADRLSVDLSDDIAGFQPRFFGRTALGHTNDQDSGLVARHAEPAFGRKLPYLDTCK